MTNLHLHINAIDTLMFRDGRPFNQADAGASEAASVFPPYPPTVVGAVRAALWQGPLQGVWCSEKLGDGTNWQADKNILNPLSFGPPILLKDGAPVFPVPLHILEGEDKDGNKQIIRLTPGDERVSDLGNNKKLSVQEDISLVGIKTIEDRWVTLAGMQRILDGCVPYKNELIKRSDLWCTEPRVGIGIKAETRTTSDGNLYMASHVRLVDEVSIYVKLSGWSDDKESKFKKSLRPLAGEHRMAEIISGNEVDPPEATIAGKEQYCLIALSPIVPTICEDGKFDIEGLPCGLLSACLGKPVVIGGWDSTGTPRGPIPLRNCYPAGSIWFLDGSETPPPTAIGLATQWGFGQVLIGKF